MITLEVLNSGTDIGYLLDNKIHITAEALEVLKAEHNDLYNVHKFSETVDGNYRILGAGAL